MLYYKEKYNKVMSKVASIISKLVSDKYQPIIERKTPQKAWTFLQKCFQFINLMSTFHFIYKVTTQNLSKFKNIYKYASHY